MVRKHYTRRQAERLLERLITVPDASSAQARRVFVEMLGARLADVVVHPAVRQHVETAPADQLARWQHETQQRLRLLRFRRAGLAPTLTIQPVSLIVSAFDVRVEVSGAPQQMIDVQTYALMRLVGHQLQRCECGRFYVRIGKRRFCSIRCQKRVYMRRFRAGETGKE